MGEDLDSRGCRCRLVGGCFDPFVDAVNDTVTDVFMIYIYICICIIKDRCIYILIYYI